MYTDNENVYSVPQGEVNWYMLTVYGYEIMNIGVGDECGEWGDGLWVGNPCHTLPVGNKYSVIWSIQSLKVKARR